MLNKKLKIFRESRHLTQGQIAAMLEMESATYGQYENRNTTWPSALLEKLFAMGMDMNDFIGDSKSKESEKIKELTIRLEERTEDRQWYRERIASALERCEKKLVSHSG